MPSISSAVAPLSGSSDRWIGSVVETTIGRLMPNIDEVGVTTTASRPGETTGPPEA